jgi:pimeloyl-ACP methyl ester carboxylesterase
MYEKNGRLQVEGGEIYFESAGEGDSIVLLHGFGLDARMWEPQFDAFAPSHRVVRYDLRGFGRSSAPPPSPYSHEDDLKALLAHLEISRAHVVGLSMGGRMALRFAAAYPNAVRSLVLADPALDGQSWSEDWQKRWAEMCGAAKAGRIDDAKKSWLEHPLFDPARADTAIASLLATMIGDYSGWHWHNRDSARNPTPPLSQRLAEFLTPTLLITGDRDLPDFLGAAELLERALPNVRRWIVQGAGHMVNLEAPREFNEQLLKFWSEQQ